jgi:GH43 family beta-xylosidase
MFAAFFSIGAAISAEETFQNPVLEKGGADPAVLTVNGTFYAYTTSADGCVLISTDLVHWNKGPQVLPEPLKRAWAPEVYYHPEDSKYYLYYTNRYKIGVAVGDKPDAMFTDLGFLAISGIDGHVFRDDDGRLYLYFTFTPSFTMFCIPLKSPTEAGGPVTKCFEISQDWEKKGFAINEGPQMLKHNGTYYLFYSGGDGQTVHYSIGYATAPGPLGPFIKFSGNPVIHGSEDIYGPGHGSFVRDRAGDWWHLYHQKTSAERGWQRFMCLDPLRIDDETGELMSIPTKGKPQPIPDTRVDRVWAPDVLPRGSYFSNSETVRITSATPDATIRYTLDGSEPSAESMVYKEPFEIRRSLIVTAKAYRNGMTESGLTRTQFVRTNWQLPPVPFTEFPSGDPPFRVNPTPNLVAPPRPPEKTTGTP